MGMFPCRCGACRCRLLVVSGAERICAACREGIHLGAPGFID